MTITLPDGAVIGPSDLFTSQGHVYVDIPPEYVPDEWADEWNLFGGRLFSLFTPMSTSGPTTTPTTQLSATQAEWYTYGMIGSLVAGVVAIIVSRFAEE